MPVMRFQNLVLSLGGILAHAQSTLPEQCATGVHAILIRGQGPGDHLNVMVTIQNLILQVIPGSTSIALPYKHGLDDHRRAAADGAYLMQEYIREYIADCPNSKIFLHGYSLVSSLCLWSDSLRFRSAFFPIPSRTQLLLSCAYLVGIIHVTGGRTGANPWAFYFCFSGRICRNFNF